MNGNDTVSGRRGNDWWRKIRRVKRCIGFSCSDKWYLNSTRILTMTIRETYMVSRTQRLHAAHQRTTCSGEKSFFEPETATESFVEQPTLNIFLCIMPSPSYNIKLSSSKVVPKMTIFHLSSQSRNTNVHVRVSCTSSVGPHLTLTPMPSIHVRVYDCSASHIYLLSGCSVSLPNSLTDHYQQNPVLLCPNNLIAFLP